MLIRSQNKEYICNIKAVYGVGYQEAHDYKRGKVEKTNHEICVDTGVVDSIGVYSTKEKALKVLDMIQEMYLTRMELDGGFDRVNGCYVQPDYWVLPKVFQMPQDEEVEE